MEIGGIKVTELAEKYGTPLYVMDQELIEENMIPNIKKTLKVTSLKQQLFMLQKLSYQRQSVN